MYNSKNGKIKENYTWKKINFLFVCVLCNYYFIIYSHYKMSTKVDKHMLSRLLYTNPVCYFIIFIFKIIYYSFIFLYLIHLHIFILFLKRCAYFLQLTTKLKGQMLWLYQIFMILFWCLLFYIYILLIITIYHG